MDISKFIEELSGFSESNDTLTRLPFTNSQKEASQYIVQTMADIGLQNIFTDKYGTIYGYLEGKTKETILIGSHYDTVIDAGKYDGIVGVAVGLSVADYFIKNNIIPHYSIGVVALNDEEGVRFNNGFLSSKVMCGYDVSFFVEKDTNKPISCFLDDNIKDVNYKQIMKNVVQFLEVHIEQGNILSDNKKQIGLVDSIVGIKRAIYTIFGRSGHAGTTPMEFRSDSLVTASRVISEIPKITEKYNNAVCTVGYIKNEPNAINVIPNKTSFSIDIRSADETVIDNIFNEIKKYCDFVSDFPANNSFIIETSMTVTPTKMDNKIISDLEAIVQKQNVSYQHISSGAGHDAQIFAKKMPTVMLFIPSYNDGISHNPNELSCVRDIQKAINILIEYVQ